MVCKENSSETELTLRMSRMVGFDVRVATEFRLPNERGWKDSLARTSMRSQIAVDDQEPPARAEDSARMKCAAFNRTTELLLRRELE